jgi:[ribosomal protein S18]-alanine N-acetyltransferase
VLVITIDTFHSRDLVGVMRLASRTLPEEYSYDFYTQLASAQGRHFRVAREVATGRMVGFLVAAREPGLQANVLLFAVEPDYQGLGIGRALLRDAQRRLALENVRQLRLEVRTDNPRAIKFYQREGFNVAGLESAVYKDGSDAIAMWKVLR